MLEDCLKSNFWAVESEKRTHLQISTRGKHKTLSMTMPQPDAVSTMNAIKLFSFRDRWNMFYVHLMCAAYFVLGIFLMVLCAFWVMMQECVHARNPHPEVPKDALITSTIGFYDKQRVANCDKEMLPTASSSKSSLTGETQAWDPFSHCVHEFTPSQEGRESE